MATGDINAQAPGAAVPSASGKQTMTYTEFLDNAPMSGFLWLLIVGVAMAQILDGLDFQSTSFALPLVIREFRITPTQAGAIPSMTNIGLLIGALVFSGLSDRFGRRPVFQWVLFTYAFGTLLSAIAWNYETLLAARVIAGLGIGAEFPVAFALLAEFSPKRLRHIIVSLGPIFFATGWFLCAAISTVVIPKYGWRAIYWVGVTPALLIIYVRQYLPESVRFLLQRGRIEEAGVIAKDLARRAGVTAELVPPSRLAAQKKPSLLEQFSAIRFAWVTIVVLGIFFFANWIQFMGFAAWLPSIFVRQGFTLTRSFNFTMIILAVTPFGQLFAMWLQDRMSRKWAMLLLSAISTVSFVAVGLAFEMKMSIAVIVGAYVGYQFFSQGIIVILYTLGAELFPTSIRSIGMGLITAFARIGAILRPFILGVFLSLGTSIHEIIYYFASPLLIAAILAVIFIRVDPRQKTLEELA